MSAWALGVGHRDAALLGNIADEALGVDLDEGDVLEDRRVVRAEDERLEPRDREPPQERGRGFAVLDAAVQRTALVLRRA